MPPGPGRDEACVRVRRVGVCGTDYHAFRGHQPFFQYPRILGHELGVEIVAVGENSLGLKEGDRCAVEPYLNCGHCIACRQGKTNCCRYLKVLGVHTDGGMCDRLIVPVAKLHKSEVLNLDQLALVETLGIGAHAVSRAALEPGQQALIVGMGPIGLSVAESARQAGAKVIAFDVSAERLNFCRQVLQAPRCLDAGRELLPQLEELLDGDLPTAVFDCTGNAESMRSSFRYVSHGGRLIFVGLFRGDVTFHDPDFHQREMTLISSRNSTGKDFRHIIHLLEAGQIDVLRWITQRASSDTVAEALPQWVAMGSRIVKALIEW